MFIAPGNYTRLDHDNTSIIIGLLGFVISFIHLFIQFIQDLLPFFVLIAVIVYWGTYEENILNKLRANIANYSITVVLILISMSSTIIFVAVSAMVPRTFLFFVIYFVTAIVSFTHNICFKKMINEKKINPKFLSTIISFILIINMLDGVKSNLKLVANVSQRDDYIKQSINIGKNDLTFPSLKINNSHISFYSDITTNSEIWPNCVLAKYYGLNTAVLEE